MDALDFRIFFQDLAGTLIYVLSTLVVFWIGIQVYDRLHRSYSTREELVVKDNVAFSLSHIGYLAGLLAVMGAALSGPTHGFVDDMIDLTIWGFLGILLLNVSLLINDLLILRPFHVRDELIRDRNAGVGAAEFGSALGNGLIIFGAVAGEGGGLVTAMVFWAAGQIVFFLAMLAYQWITPFDFLAELEKDNVAAGVAFAGVLIATANVIRMGIGGDFESWTASMNQFVSWAVIALLLLPLVRWIADLVLLPGATFTDEIAHQDRPNLGAGLIEAFSYIAASILLGWVV